MLSDDRLPAEGASVLTQPLAESWQRSQGYGLTRTDQHIPFIKAGLLEELRSRNDWVPQRVQPLIEQLGAQITRQPAIVVIADADGLVLETRGNTDFLHKASRFALAPGNQWGEAERGTNAIGTALALGAFCEVRGDQHFLNQNAGLNCTAAPIYRPDGRIAGILDLSAPAQRPYRDAQRLIMQAVRHIEHRWVRSAIADRHWTLRLHADARCLGSAQELLLVFHDEVLIAANRLAMMEFRLSSASFGSVEFTQLFPDLLRQPSGAPRQTLAGNQQHYYSLLEAPQRRVSALRSAPPAERHDEQHQKALRILNAGLSLCVTGETGCGKEHFSRRLFQESRWRNGNFVAINCAALPEPLIESELFGYAPGAFTGANPKGYIGKIREADGGVLFLDEIGDMPAGLQTRLLRVLQEKTVTPLGSRSAYPVEFALVCATHHDLHRQVEAGAFREDLLYRIQEYSLRIPPLRERAQLEAFILQLWRELGGERRDIRLLPDALAMLARYPWPGNVRQLLSTLKVLLALADDHAVLTLDDLPQSIAVLAPRQENADTDQGRCRRRSTGRAAISAGRRRRSAFRAARCTASWEGRKRRRNEAA